MDDAVRHNRTAGERATEKYVREHDDLLRAAREPTRPTDAPPNWG
ncbi:hypothetical protein [Micromonospora sp. KC207]|nr:hypothetical protein [Micromonospora sp. KC207]